MSLLVITLCARRIDGLLKRKDLMANGFLNVLNLVHLSQCSNILVATSPVLISMDKKFPDMQNNLNVSMHLIHASF